MMMGKKIGTVPISNIVGLMSGTSCDGIDAGWVRIEGSGPESTVHLKDFQTFPYPSGLKALLLSPRLDARDICLLNFELGERFADAVNEMIELAGSQGVPLDFVASHGHTVAHYPSTKGDQACGTLQIGEAAVVAERTGLTVVSDFRPRDMAAGGQGAPLVPYADWLLFRREIGCVACLNIGGIANVTVVPPAFEEIIAFDTGPGNMIIDGTVRMLSEGSLEMDKDGATAAKGKVIQELFDRLLGHPYFALEPPKSTGREQFGPEIYHREALAPHEDRSFEDLVATVTAVTAQSIASAFDRFVKPRYALEQVIISGGGAYNKTLVALIREGLGGIQVCTSEDHGIPSDAREAIAFAILGNETMHGRPANVPGATGARRPVVLGKITPA
jgi:anhydro-N-acetylmuramic acid kinase